jgi:hypothetical protein
MDKALNQILNIIILLAISVTLFSTSSFAQSCDTNEIANLKDQLEKHQGNCNLASGRVKQNQAQSSSLNAQLKTSQASAEKKFGKKCISKLSAKKSSNIGCKQSLLKNAKKNVESIKRLKTSLGKLQRNSPTLVEAASFVCELYNSTKVTYDEKQSSCNLPNNGNTTTQPTAIEPLLPTIDPNSPFQPSNFVEIPTLKEESSGFPIQYLSGRWLYRTGNMGMFSGGDPYTNPNYDGSSGVQVELLLGTNQVYRLYNYQYIKSFGATCNYLVSEYGNYSASSDAITFNPINITQEVICMKGSNITQNTTQTFSNTGLRTNLLSTAIYQPLSNSISNNGSIYNYGLKINLPCRDYRPQYCYTGATIDGEGHWNLQKVENNKNP